MRTRASGGVQGRLIEIGSRRFRVMSARWPGTDMGAHPRTVRDQVIGSAKAEVVQGQTRLSLPLPVEQTFVCYFLAATIVTSR